MAPNLHDYSLRSKKISKDVLDSSEKKNSFQMWQLLSAHFLDFISVLFITSIITTVFQLSARAFLPTSTLQTVYDDIGIESFGYSLVPLIIASYYFFCFFLNHGQSYGMRKMNKRIILKKHSFTESLLWSARSSSIILTCGLSIPFIKATYASALGPHDHAYQSMMIARDWPSPSLLEKTVEVSSAPSSEEFFDRAA